MTAGSINLHGMKAEDLLASSSPAARDAMLMQLVTDKNSDVTNVGILASCDPDIVKRSGEEALFAACANGRLDCVKALHAAGVRIDGFYFDDRDPSVTIHQYPLYKAFYEGKWDVAEWLIEQGAQVMHQPRLLGNMVPDAPKLFAYMLAQKNYVQAYLMPKEERATYEEKVMADALWAAIEVIVYNNRTVFADILVAAGVPQEELYRQAMRKQAADILEGLYAAGYRPDVEVEKIALEELYKPDANQDRLWKCAAVRHKWLRHDSHIKLAGDDVDVCRAAVAQDYNAQIADKPALLTLARGGYFASDVAPLVVRYGAAVLAVKDRYGVTLGDVIATRNEEKELFVPARWSGDAAGARACHAALPEQARLRVDIDAVAAAINRHHLQQHKAGAGRFKLGGRKP